MRLCTRIALGFVVLVFVFGMTESAVIGAEPKATSSNLSTTTSGDIARSISVNIGMRVQSYFFLVNRFGGDLGLRFGRYVGAGVLGGYAWVTCSDGCGFSPSRVEGVWFLPYLEGRLTPTTPTPYFRLAGGLSGVATGYRHTPALLGHVELGADVHKTPRGLTLRLFLASEATNYIVLPVCLGIQLGNVF